MVDRIRALRIDRGWSQGELATRAGVTRQLVSAVESGRHAPNVAAALGLARALGTTVESLFSADEPAVTPVLGAALADGTPVVTATVGDATVVAPLRHATVEGESWAVADASVRDGAMAWLPGGAVDGFVVVGCDPLLGLLAGIVGRTSGHRIVAVHGATADAVEALAAGRTHAGLVHGPHGLLPEPPAGVRRWHLARWRVGLAARGRRPPPSPAEIAERRLRIVRRGDGAASSAALARALRRAGGDGRVHGPVGTGHLDVARRVATAGPSAGLTMEPAAIAFDLGFTPLEEHVVELWVDERWATLPAATALLEVASSPGLVDRAALVPGYDLTDSGTERRAG